jgi:hypothetical protein
LQLSGPPRLITTKQNREIIGPGKGIPRMEDLSISPLEEGGARRGSVTYFHTTSSEPFQKPGTTFRLTAEDVFGRAVVGEHQINPN